MLVVLALHDLMTSLGVIIFPEPSPQRLLTKVQTLGNLAHEGGLTLGVFIPFPSPLPRSCWPFVL